MLLYADTDLQYADSRAREGGSLLGENSGE
jgi:hypothetical protein